MDMMISNNSADQVMTIDQLKKEVPFAFLNAPTRQVSSKYVHVPTSRVIDDLMSMGWQPVQAAQRRGRAGKTSMFSKHMIKFQNPNLIIKGNEGDDVFPQIILTNSHDGTQSFKFMMGLYRLVCSNGLVIADEEFASFKIRHMGYSFEDLQQLITNAVEELPKKVEVINTMKSVELTEKQQKDLAFKAFLLRQGIALESEQAKEVEISDEVLENILETQRAEDAGNDLWVTFNRVQEAITQGGFQGALQGAKIRKVRKIKSFEKDLKLNQQLFDLALQYV
jgi:hypothetical protein